jgi:hypothetical protein
LDEVRRYTHPNYLLHVVHGIPYPCVSWCDEKWREGTKVTFDQVRRLRMGIEPHLIPTKSDSYPIEFERTETNTVKQERGVYAGWERSQRLLKRPKKGVCRTGGSP